MKKLICILLLIIMLLSITIAPTFASEAEDFYAKYNLYSEKFIDRYVGSIGSMSYKELYYHHTDRDNPDSQIEWSLVRGYAGWEQFSRYITNYAVVGDRVICQEDGQEPFNLGYCIYDVQKDEFIHIADVDVNDYDGLNQCLNVLKIGRPIGDADCDYELSVLDATEIQRTLAHLTELGVKDMLSGRAYFICVGNDMKYVSDFDRDGYVSIIDATAIQMKLAKLDVPVATADEV